MKTDFCGMEKTSLVDYEGKIACVLFVGGCNFRCPFCHNSDLVLNSNQTPKLTEEEILDYLQKRKDILDGVVITGGEPTLYPSIFEIIPKIKSIGLLVKLDTNGTNPQVIQKLVEQNLIDYIAMDIKNGLSSYSKTIGTETDLNKIKQSIEYIKNCGLSYEFRTTLVKELHAERDIKEIAVMLKDCKKLFLQKFVDSGSCIKNNLHEIPKEQAQNFKNILTPYVKKVELRGY